MHVGWGDQIVSPGSLGSKYSLIFLSGKITDLGGAIVGIYEIINK